MDAEEESVKDLSFKLEDMEIDVVERTEEEIYIERSDMMDRKIAEREKEMEEKEKILNKKRTEIEEKKKLDVGNKLKLKEKEKNGRKLKSKKEKIKVKVVSKEQFQKKVKHAVPNIKDIPDNCCHLFNDGDLLYVVPGDGSCGPSCASAHLFQDEVFGPKLRRKMNIFLARHWYSKYQYLTQCSPKHPVVRKCPKLES